ESCFAGRTRCNDFSIGVELEGCEQDSFTSAQYAALADVTLALQKAYPGISNAHITGHQQIAPGRKTDPGPGFDWLHYRSLHLQALADKA
ncbi:MAG: 1,6-anhydro-N-acetylmuramyl-L-alanine amidase AmpD, partial [Pseudomonadales bacterium]|nr:1,6-anhydro-N-acetylmuramyl-L-alanine amidase AmpD [Pseudomonadales bacterium]